MERTMTLCNATPVSGQSGIKSYSKVLILSGEERTFLTERLIVPDAQDVSDNNLQSRGAKEFGAMLAINETLQQLNLAGWFG